ncbi:MAG TPA: transposase [Acidimicrobiales bacterium]|nr:transposase [Acidimicrobiales bacterium]
MHAPSRTRTARASHTSRRRWYPPELRSEAVTQVGRLIEDEGEARSRAISRVATELDIGRESLRTWVRKAEAEGSTLRVSDTRHTTASGARLTVMRDRLPEEEPQGEAEQAPRPRWQRPLAAYLASRLAMLIVVELAASHPGRGLVALPKGFVNWPAVTSGSRFLNALGVWDAGWYVHIATHSYSPPPLVPSPLGGDMAFFPLFPLLVRAVAFATGLSPLAAGALLAVVTGMTATLAVWSLAAHIAGDRVADRVAVLWCFFPAAFVLSLVYAEGLTVTCAAVCLLMLMRGRWVVAGLAAAAAGASQPAALVLVACCTWAAAGAIRNQRRWPALSAPLLAPTGALAYFGYLWARTGDPLAWFDSQRLFWNHQRMGPYWTVIQPVVRLFQSPGLLDNTVLVAGLVFAIGAGLALWRWRPPAILSIWAAGVMALALMSAPVGTRPRFLFVAFPLIFALAVRMGRRTYYTAVALSVPLFGALTYLTITTLAAVP